MITDAILAVIFGPLRALVGLLPTWTLPAWLSSTGANSMGDMAYMIGGKLDGLDAWVPMGTAVDLFGWYLGLLAAVFIWKAVQFGVSLFTGGGGST